MIGLYHLPGTPRRWAEARHAAAEKRSGNNPVYALEDSTGRPSRKSSRKSSNRQKTDVQFRMKRGASAVRTSTGIGRKR